MAKNLFIISVIAICLFAFAGNNKKEVIFTKLAPAPIGPYSQAIRCGGTLFVSGQIGLRTDGTFDSTSIENETRQALENIRVIVEHSGMKMSDVTKSTIYTTDLRNFSKINEIYRTFFLSDPPARETVEVKGLPKGAHVEISVVAD
jgi:2-iminobutanoate/2-iminopropanoate deaminase